MQHDHVHTALGENALRHRAHMLFEFVYQLLAPGTEVALSLVLRPDQFLTGTLHKCTQLRLLRGRRHIAELLAPDFDMLAGRLSRFLKP